MAFQLVKYGMSGGCNLLEMIYGEKFDVDILASQAAKTLFMCCLEHDNEIEQLYNQTAESSVKGTQIVSPHKIQDMLFKHKYPELTDCIVTVLTTQEYLKIAKPQDFDSDVS